MPSKLPLNHKNAEALAKNIHYGNIFAHMVEGFAYCRMIFEKDQAVDWVYLAVNQSFTRLTGFRDAVGRRVSEVIPGIRENDPKFFDLCAKVALTGQNEKFETLVTSLNIWFSVSAYSPERGYFIAFFDNITHRKIAEIEREKLLLESMRTKGLLSADMVAMQQLHDLGTLFLKDGNLQEILAEVVDAAIDISAADFGSIQLFDPVTQTLHIVVQRGFPQWWIDYWNEIPTTQGACGTAIRQQKRVIIEDIEKNPIFAGAPCLEQQRRVGIQAVQSTPLYSRSGRLIGVFSTHYRSPHQFSEKTLQLIDLLARHAADIIDRAESDKVLKLSQLRLGLAMEAAHAGFWQWDLQTNENVWSEEICKVYGLKSHSVKPSYRTWLETIHPDDRDGAVRLVSEAVRASADLQAEWRILQPNGTERWLMFRGRPEKDEQGTVVRYNGIAIDITQQKQIEKELFTSKAMLEAALASMTDAVFIADSQGRIIHVNEAVAAFNRFKTAEECPKSRTEYLAVLDIYKEDGELVPVEQWPVFRALRGESASNEEYTMRRKDTDATWIASFSFAPIIGQAGGIVGAVVVGRDISESKAAEWQRLQQLKDRYRAIVMDQNEMICRFDRQGRITFVNDAYCRTFGVSYQEILGSNFLPHIYADDLTLVQDHFKGLTMTEPYRSIEHRVYLPNGELHWQQWSGRALFNDNAQLVEYQAVGRDITARKEMEKKLEDELSLRQHFMDGLPGLAFLIRYDTHEIISANKTAINEGILISQPCYTWFGKHSPCPWCLAPRLWETREPQNCRFFYKDKYWNAHWVPINGDQLYLHYLFDVSIEEKAKHELLQAREELEQRVKERTLELQKSHAQLMHSEKLSAVGSLSASIAHEFNNPLQSVMTVLNGLPQYISLPKREEGLVKLALQECHRMRDLINDLRDFYQPTTNTSTLLDLHRMLDGLLLLSKKDFLVRKIQVKKRYSRNLPQIMGVNDQLKQVFLNILNNAAYACRDGGTITVATEQIGREVVIHIEDTGTGIKETDLPRIFEPFFTTKPDLKGNGLGLSVSYGIINSHGGRIIVKSEFGKGSIFSVVIPIQRVCHGTEIDTSGRR
jgi:PAS domain S-box-containing protein